MALLTQPTFLLGPGVGSPGEVHSSQKNEVLKRRKGPNGTEYIYLQGVASCAVGSWVIYDEDGVTTLLDSGAVTTLGHSLIAVACAVVDATTEFGWFQIFGEAEGLCLASFADEGLVYATTTNGSVDDADVTLAIVQGAIGVSARDTTTGTARFLLSYPHNTPVAFD